MADVVTEQAQESNPVDNIVGMTYENGEIQLQFAEPETTEEPAPEPEKKEEPAKAAPEHDYQKRYEDLLPEFTRKSEELKRAMEKLEALEARLTGPKKEEPAPPADPWDGVDLREVLLNGDAKEVRELLDKTVERRVSSIINPVLQQLVPFVEQMQVASVVNDLVTKHPDALDYVEEIREVLNLEGTETLSLEQAYTVAKGVRARLAATSPSKKEGAPPPVATPATPSPAPTKKESREELERAAARLKSPADTGRAGTVEEPERVVDSIRGAFEQALLDATRARS